MNIRGIVKAVLLAAMLLSFFISNGITGTGYSSKGCSTAGGLCSSTTCDRPDGTGGNFCCVGGNDSPCACVDITDTCSQ
jgi:hypothetical protein